MPREDLSRNLVEKFFPDLEERIRKIFTEVEKTGGSFARGNIRYEVKGGPHNQMELYRELIRLYSVDCKVDIDEYDGVIDGIYATCDNHKVFILVELCDSRLSISAWVSN